MAAHKNQHFVPRIYMAPFSVDGEGRSINLLNIRSSRLIHGAPLRSQCARDYLYSPADNMGLEKLLQEIEGEYAAALRTLSDPRAPATSGDMMDRLRMFTFIQHLRTERAMLATKAMSEQVYASSFEGVLADRAPLPIHRDRSDRDIMHDTMRAGMLSLEYVSDLKHCIIDNSSGVDFITSDDPAVLTNRFLKQRHHHTNFGLASSGAMFVLPLSPKQLFLLYDGGVYTIPDKDNGRLRIVRKASVRAFNELQLIRAAENIYFADQQTGGDVSQALADVKEQRRASWTSARVLVPDGPQRFRLPTSEQERLGTRAKVVHVASELPASTTWATEIKIRDPVRTYSNGSAIGMVRKREWLTSLAHRDLRSRSQTILEK